jgi:hypothetical protein
MKTEELVRMYFGIDRRRHTMEELGILFGNAIHATELLHSAIEKLRYSDEILATSICTVNPF